MSSTKPKGKTHTSSCHERVTQHHTSVFGVEKRGANRLLTEVRAFRQALRYIIRNTTLPQRARAQAQLQLSQMHCYTRFTQIKNRCIEGGKGRGVFRHFRMARVSGGSRRVLHLRMADPFCSLTSDKMPWKAIYLVSRKRVGEGFVQWDGGSRNGRWQVHMNASHGVEGSKHIWEFRFDLRLLYLVPKNSFTFFSMFLHPGN